MMMLVIVCSIHGPSDNNDAYNPAFLISTVISSTQVYVSDLSREKLFMCATMSLQSGCSTSPKEVESNATHYSTDWKHQTNLVLFYSPYNWAHFRLQFPGQVSHIHSSPSLPNSQSISVILATCLCSKKKKCALE